MKILGFDLGDGESAVTILDEDSSIEPRVMPLCGRTSLLSAVGMKDGKIVIGEEASVRSGSMDAQVRFKSRYLTDPDAPRAVRTFAQGVMAELTQQEPGLMAEVSRTVVGCPAGWGEGRRDQYAALLESAGFPNVSVVPEPRAAFLYARHARGLRIDANLMRQSAMVIDIGSSTTDFAYIVDGHQQNLALFGDANLGGGLLDEQILRYAIKNSPDRALLEQVMQMSHAWRSYCELEARRLKEKYFMSESKWNDTTLTAPLTICYDMTLMLELKLNAEVMEEVINAPIEALGGRSFMTCLEDSLRASREASRDCPPKVVILTGGASRMTFFQKACQDAFEDSLVVLCPEPECSIARGLAYAGRVDERLKEFRKEVASIARGEKLNMLVNGSVYELYGPISSVLFEAAKESALKSVKLWRRGAVDTIDELDAVLSQDIEKTFASDKIKDSVAKELTGWTAELMKAVEGELTALCLRCGVPPEKMSLGDAQVDTGLESIKLSVLDALGMDMISGLLSVVLAVIGAAICGGSGVALVSTGPLGLLAGAAAGVTLAVAGKASMEKYLRKMDVPMVVRRVVTDKIVAKGIDRQREEIETAIVKSLADPRNGFASRLCVSLSQTLGVQMEEMAKDAEMSICA